MGYLWARFGDPLLFSKAEREYRHRSLHWPWVDVWRAGEAAFRTIREMITHSSGLPGGLVPGHHLEILLAHNVLPFVALVFALCCLVVVFRRLPFAYGLFALLSLLLPLLEPSDGHPLYSFHRFTLVIYPLFMALAIVLRKRPALLWTWVGASFVLMLYLAGTAVIGAGGV